MRYGAAALFLVACGGGGTSTPDAPSGANTVSGQVNGRTFDTVMASYWIGSGDSPSTDTVVYLFDRPVVCGALVNAGWDSVLTSDTQILELKLVGKNAMSYPQTTAATHVPAPGESAASYTLAAPTAMDLGATVGSVSLTSIETEGDGHFGAGTFMLTFANGSLTGSFAAPFCKPGREP